MFNILLKRVMRIIILVDDEKGCHHTPLSNYI
jgi:hypothetical protein